MERSRLVRTQATALSTRSAIGNVPLRVLTTIGGVGWLALVRY